MRKFILDKIVRSKLIVRMIANKTEVDSTNLSGDQAYEAVLRKVIEEAQEALTAPREKRAGELADVQTALKDAISLSGIPPAEVDRLETLFATEKGRFTPTIYVHAVKVQDDDPMADYYASQPDRYPEIR